VSYDSTNLQPPGKYPADWQTVPFDGFATLKRGKDLTRDQFREGTIPVASSNGCMGFHDTANVKAPGVTVGRSGSVGRVTFYTEDFWAHNTALFVTDFHGNDARFAAYFLDSLKLNRFGSGVSVPTLDRNVFKDLPVTVPPLPEQQKIAAVLGVVQRAMEQQERLLALTAELKKTLLHQLFTQGLPSIDSSTGGLRHEPQKQTDIGPVPDSWEVVKLGELFQIKHGFAFAGEFFQPQGRYILLTPGHYHEDGGFRDQGQKTKYYAGEFPSSYILNKDDLLVVMTEQKEGLLGSSLLVPQAELYLHNQRLGLIQDLNETRLRRHFLYYLFNTPPVRKRISMTASGSKVRHTSPGKIRDTLVALPPVAHQEHAIEVLEAVDRKLDTATRKHATLTALFRTLLHQLMTAQIRVGELVLLGAATGSE
jgi:type I restriction enzyme S subunit